MHGLGYVLQDLKKCAVKLKVYS